METLTADTLLVALRDGGRCTQDQLHSVEQAFAKVGSEYAALADALQSLGVLTRYQYRKVQLGRFSELLFGQYLILEKIGEGGMGKVYRAVDTRMSRMVALKVVRPQLMSNKTVLKRYEREAEAAGKLDHPNIVKLFDAGEAGGRFYLAMEYVDGSDLSRLVKDNGALSVAEACEYMRMTALGLQHAHDNYFVHRDIKPSNLLVYGERAIPGTGGRAQLKILDMGLVRSMADDDSPGHTELTRDGTVVGTPDYMSPEQAKNSSSVDARADLYSLGCTLYYLLRGVVPFPEGTPIDKLIRHQLDPVPDVRQGRSDIPHMVGDIVSKLLKKKPDERYQTAAEVAALLAYFTPDAAAMDFSPPSAGPKSKAAAYVPIDLSPPKALESVLGPPVARSTPMVTVSTQTPKSPLPAQGQPVRKVTVVPKAIIPKPRTEPDSSESLPNRGDTKKVSRTEHSGRIPRKGKPRKPVKSFPVLTVVVVVVFALLLLGLGIFALIQLGGNKTSPTTTPPTEPKKTAPTVAEPPPKNYYRPTDLLLPDNTEAVLLIHAKPFWDKIAAEWRPGSRIARIVEYLTLRFHFDPRKFERATVAFQADPTDGIAAGEGAWLSPEWIGALDKAKRLKVEPADNRGTQTVKFFEPGPLGRELSATRGAILKGQAYAIGERGALDSLTFRLKTSDELTAIDPLLLAPVSAAAKGTPLLYLAAAGGFQLPAKAGARVETLATYGVDLMTVSGKLDRDFQLDVVLIGRDNKQMKEFLGVALPKLFDARNDKLKPLADAIRSASDDAKVELDTQHGFRIKVSVAWKWADLIAGLEAVIPPPPVLEK